MGPRHEVGDMVVWWWSAWGWGNTGETEGRAEGGEERESEGKEMCELERGGGSRGERSKVATAQVVRRQWWRGKEE